MGFSSEIEGNIMVYFVLYVREQQLFASWIIRQITFHSITDEITDGDFKATQSKTTLHNFLTAFKQFASVNLDRSPGALTGMQLCVTSFHWIDM